MFLFSPPQFFIIFLPQCFLFPSTTILIFSLNFIMFPPQCYYSLLYNFIIFPPLPPPSSSSSLLLFSLLHLLILIVFPFPPHFECFDRVDVGSMQGRCGVRSASIYKRKNAVLPNVYYCYYYFIPSVAKPTLIFLICCLCRLQLSFNTYLLLRVNALFHCIIEFLLKAVRPIL